jgi:serine/threonine-protein kinase
LLHPIATGGMAQVWEAEDEVLARSVAVKLLHTHLASDAAFVERFRHEAIAAARLSHPSIVSIYDTVSEPDLEAIVMELVRGTTLRKRLDEQHVLETPEVVAIGVQVADALDTAHRAHVVHRDIKPANILLSTDERVLVADFGIAKAFEGADLTVDGAMIGTAKYLAPEQVEGGPVDGRTDLYSLGVVLYEALCGRPPFLADTDTATAIARLHQAPLRPRQLRAGIPRPIEDVVLRALARHPADRFADAAEFRASLLAAFQGQVPDLPPVIDQTTITDPTVVPHSATPPAGIGRVRGVPATVGAAAEPEPTPSFRETERGWLLPTLLIVLVAVALGVAGVLFGQTDAAHRLFGSAKPPPTTVAAPVALELTSAVPFDPDGDGVEDNGDAANVLDGKPTTSWHTETYQVGAEITRLKPGVGIYVTLAGVHALHSLAITSPSSGWSASIYVTDQHPGTTLASWGKPVATKAAIQAGRTDVSLGNTKGQAVLVWITRLAPDGQVRIAELGVTG